MHGQHQHGPDNVRGRLPEPAETVATDTFATYPGGKSGNQAVAAARLGGEVGIFGQAGRRHVQQGAVY